MGLLALTGALVLALAGGLTALPGRLRDGLAAQAAASALLGIAGIGVLARGERLGAAWHDGVSPALGLDPLSGFFLAVLGLAAVPTLLSARASVRSPAVGALFAPFVLALAGLLAARDITTFLAAWELMTLIPAAAILANRRDAPVRAAVQRYVAITHLGGAGVWIALLALAAPGPVGPGTRTVVAVAALVGFGTKAGLVPLHSWLPQAHPVAPAPYSALMSGVMVKVAVYGLIRVEFDWLGAPPRWLGFALLATGVLSALGGAVWALLQHDLKRLLAYSTIENVGVIAAALGASILIADPVWSALAFGAALLHTATHAGFKVLVFLGAGAIERATGTLDLDRMGGLARRMPWTGAAFAVGCASIAAMPPLSGFASEWLALQSLAHLAFDGPVASGLAGAAALAAVAATAALAALCFVNVGGLVLLGAPRGAGTTGAGEAPLAMRGALVFLALVCVGLGIAAPALIGVLAGLAPGAPAHPVPTGTGSLHTAALAVVLVAVTALLVRVRGNRRAATAPTWACGQRVTPALGWTSAGFTKPLRLVLEAVLRPRRALTVERAGGVMTRIRYERELASPADRLLYRPAIRGALAGAALTRRLQTGNVRTYAAYLLALVLGLLVLVRAGGLG
jgi:hydrogenase-4 component B